MTTCKLTFHAFLGISVDGFIARPDGSVDFLDEANKLVPKGEDCGIADFMESINAILMGRRTYEQVLEFKRQGKGWQYGDTPLFVLSTSLVALPKDSPESVRILHLDQQIEGDADGLVTIMDAIKEQLGDHQHKDEIRVYVDGGQIVNLFINAQRLDELTLTTVPMLIGAGKTIFGGHTGKERAKVQLQLVECKTWDFGFVQVRYKLSGPPCLSEPSGSAEALRSEDGLKNIP